MKSHSHRVGIRTCSDYSPFGVELDGRTVSGGYRFGYQNQEKDDEIKGEGNSVNYSYRIQETRLGRFFIIDPIAGMFSWNSTYAFCENRLIDGIDMEGLEWENFMSFFKKPGELKVKLPNLKNAQQQTYTITYHNTKVSFEDFKKNFKNTPQKYLTNSKATFHAPVNADGKPSQFKEGAFIKIDIIGPMNNCFVKVGSITESKDGSLTATFYTLEGHVEKGIISFTISKGSKKGDINFTINSKSQVDYGMITESFAREGQIESWIDMLRNTGELLGDKGDSNGYQTIKLRIEKPSGNNENKVENINIKEKIN